MVIPMSIFMFSHRNAVGQWLPQYALGGSWNSFFAISDMVGPVKQVFDRCV
jgi:hypothetical protein